MENKLEYILSILPKVEIIKAKVEADYYGLSYLIAKKNKFPIVPRSLAGWKHGWLFSKLKYSEQLTGGQSEQMFLVPLVEHEIFLTKKGIKAKAVGMPFVYIEDVDAKVINRQKNTLLVMPPHSLPYTEHSWDENSYVKEIYALKNKFELIVVCLHQSCFDKGLWVNTFGKHGIPCIVGANGNDKNALIRMYRLFNCFEFMTTNTIGSHVVYAEYCGCKVSIYGKYAKYSKNDYSDTPFYNEFPFMLEYNLKHSSYEYIVELFPFLFSSPEKAEINFEWAKIQLGKSNKVTFKELRYLLGWTPYQQSVFFIKKVFFKIKKAFFMSVDLVCRYLTGRR